LTSVSARSSVKLVARAGLDQLPILRHAQPRELELGLDLLDARIRLLDGAAGFTYLADGAGELLVELLAGGAGVGELRLERAHAQRVRAWDRS
jgi:hypothetical protein